MSRPGEPPPVPSEPGPVRVATGGPSGPVATIVMVAALAIVIGVALLGQLGDPSSGTGDVAHAPAATRTTAPVSRPTPAGLRSPHAPPSPVVSDRARPVPDIAGALPGDGGVGPLPLGTIDEVPSPDRLDFLFELCAPDCVLDAHWMDPENPGLGSGVWTAGRRFHVREGFINERPEPLGDGFDVVLYVTRLDGGADEPTYRYTSDYVLRGTSDHCGPTYKTQAGPRTCEWFVHDFPKGLPEGRFAITARWLAPCWAWMVLGTTDSCLDPDEVMSLFSSSFDAPYGRSGPSYTEVSS